MASKASIGSGNVDMELDGSKVTLKPTIKAAQGISRQYGGFIAAIGELNKFNLDALTQVVAFGLNKEPNDIADRVWRTGAAQMTPHAIRYISILMNGGRPIEASKEDEEEAADPQ